MAIFARIGRLFRGFLGLFISGIEEANPEALMAQMDGNKDGKVTKAEHAAAGKARFTQLDTNKDGVLTEAEARAAAAKEK